MFLANFMQISYNALSVQNKQTVESGICIYM